ncbi:MAG: hypothetical protein H7X80_03880, partial [bacterium]|nr:hypothetical protein [Candidatus Kapabacteria bacterium]
MNEQNENASADEPNNTANEPAQESIVADEIGDEVGHEASVPFDGETDDLTPENLEAANDVDGVELESADVAPAIVNAEYPGTLTIVATPFANSGDLTLRAARALQNADAIICHEYKSGARVLREHNLSKKLIEMDEAHADDVMRDMLGMLRNGKNVVVMAQTGVPAETDPATTIMQVAVDLGIEPKVMPGVSQVMGL